MAVASLVVRISAQIAEFEKGLASAERSFQKTGKNLESIGKRLTQGVTLPIVAIAGVAAKAAIDFESSFAGVRKTVDATEAQFKELEGQFRNLAKTMPLSVNEINKVAEAAGQLGVKREAIVGFTETMVKLGATTNLTAEEAATAMARFANAMGKPDVDINKLGASLVALGNAGASTEKDILEMAGRIAGAGAQIKLTEGSVFGIANALSSVGIDAEKGGSAISRLFNDMSEAATFGGKQLEGFAKIAKQSIDGAKLSTAEFANLFKTDSAAAISQFVEGLNNIKTSGGNLLPVLNELGITEMRYRDTVLLAANSGKQFAESIQLGNKAFGEGKALNNEYNERLKTTASQLIILKNNVHDAAITLGQAFLPLINDAVSGLRPLVGLLANLAEAFGKLPEPIRNTTIALFALLALAGPTVFVVGKVTQAWAAFLAVIRFVPVALAFLPRAFLAVTAGLTGVATGVTGTTGVMLVLRGAVAGLLGPIGLLTLAVGGLVAAFPKAVEGVGNLSKAISEGRFWQFVTTKDAPAIWEKAFWGIGTAADAAAEGLGHVAVKGKDILLPLDATAKAAAEAGAALKKSLTGEGLTEEVAKLANAFAAMTPQQQRAADVMKRVGAEALRLRDAGATLPPELNKLANAMARIESKGPVDALKSFKDSLSSLTAQIDAAVAEGTPLAEMVDEWGQQAAKTTQKADRLGIAVKDSARKVADGFNAMKFAETAADIEALRLEMAAPFKIEGLAEVGTDLEQLRKDIDALADARKRLSEAQERVADIGRSPFEQQLVDIERARKAEIDAINAVQDKHEDLRREQIRLTNQYYDHLRNKAVGTADTLIERMNAQGIFTKKQYKEMAEALERTYAQMLASTDEFNREDLAKFREHIDQLIVASGGKAKIDWAKRFEGFKDAIQQIGLDAAHGLAEALAEGINTGDWSQLENNLKAVFADIFGSIIAAAVDFFVPGLGQALKPLLVALGDKIAGWLGFGTKGRDAVKEFAASMGGFDAVRDKLRELGAEGEKLWVNLTQGVGRNNPEQAKAAIDAITQALDRADKGMAKFVDGAMKRIKAFADSFKTASGQTLAELRKLIEFEMPELEMGVDEANVRAQIEGIKGIQKGVITQVLLDAAGGWAKLTAMSNDALAELEDRFDLAAGSIGDAISTAMTDAEGNIVLGGQGMQEEFARLGLYAGTAFAETLRDKGLAEAIRVAGPMFDELNALSAEFGFTLEGSAAQFAEFFRVAKENEDVVSALDAITQMVQGAGDAAFLTHELFSAFSLDAVAQFEKLQQRGVDANSAMALMQPTLQALWEAQQKFGFETDAATQALIDQGIEQGIVGANMRDVNEKILDVLLAIAKVFKADIPAGLDATAQKSKQTADTMARDFDAAGRRAKDSLSGIKVPDIEVKVNYVTGDVETPEFPDVPAFAKGGIVRKPTLAVIGEAGPELVIPLQRLREMAFLDGLRDRYGIPGLQHGGIVRSPTLALVGEAGPELVIPLSQLGATGPQGTQVILEVDGRAIAEVMVPHIPGAVTRLGLGI